MAPGSDVRRPTGVLAGDEPDGEERRGRKEPRRGRRLGERESAMRLPRKGEGEQRREVRGAEPGMPRTPARNWTRLNILLDAGLMQPVVLIDKNTAGCKEVIT